jgi:hypothetical protein
MLTFMGDILPRIKSRIETATLVIADLTAPIRMYTLKSDLLGEETVRLFC